jgi:hypothetical protein
MDEDTMPDRERQGDHSTNGAPRKGPRNDGPRSGPPKKGPPKKKGGLRLRLLGEDDYEFDHPPCVEETELDYAEGLEFLEAGDPESARDALRYALQGCGDNLYVHTALGQLALSEFNDPKLARGHFGFGFELGVNALPPNFHGRLPAHRVANKPFLEAAAGLIKCYEALGMPRDAADLAASLRRWTRP